MCASGRAGTSNKERGTRNNEQATRNKALGIFASLFALPSGVPERGREPSFVLWIAGMNLCRR
jgi:hypothetical protein